MLNNNVALPADMIEIVYKLTKSSLTIEFSQYITAVGANQTMG